MGIESKLAALSFGCLNVRSCNLTDSTGRNCISKFTWIIKKKMDFVFLSELKFHNKSFLNKLSNFLMSNDICQYQLILNSSKQSRGTAILVKNSLDFVIQQIDKDHNENFIILNCKINQLNLTLASIYAPSGNFSNFFERVKQKVDAFGHPYIIGGDFNTILNPLPNDLNPDLHNHSSQCNVLGTKFINNWMEK